MTQKINDLEVKSILALLPEETDNTLTLEEKMEIVKEFLNYDVTGLFNNVLSFVNKI